MYRTGILLAGLFLSIVPVSHAQNGDKPEPKKLPPALAEMLKGTPDDFLKRFDKNQDGALSKDELPPFLAERFDNIDRNGDGKIDRQEVEQLFQFLRTRFAQEQPTPGGGATVEKVLAKLMMFDTDKDGKISRDEAKGRLAENFDKIDLNNDGFLDRNELRKVAERIAVFQKGNPGGAAPEQSGRTGPDFDALDRNADGRLTREELKGTPLESQFERIDTNGDGRIDRREFEAFFKNKEKEPPK